jgi:hypothetical protein
MKFYFDKIINKKPYPNLATHIAKPYTPGWREFSSKHPFSEPANLLDFMDYNEVPYKIVPFNNTDNDTFYMIAISWFDFSVDWFSLMSDKVINKVKNNELKILLYYWEADNPYRIQEHITNQSNEYNIPIEQIKFISGNSEANKIPNFYHFVDDELLFQFRNKEIKPLPFHTEPRTKKYTALVRMHKFWRANTMATLWQKRLDTEGYFAYGNAIDSGEDESDNPIEVDKYMGLRALTRTFLTITPFVADTLSEDEHNDHKLQVQEHYNNAYINVVLESHMDVDHSNGVLLTEKTFKPIKNAQMFIIFGACGSLQLLRDMGYKTFDHVLNNSYDSIENTTERWKTAINMLTTVLDRSYDDIHEMHLKCEDDLIHNQELFNANKADRLTALIIKLSK